MAIVERCKHELMYKLSPKKTGHWREVAVIEMPVSGGSTVLTEL